jgi:nitroreductase
MDGFLELAERRKSVRGYTDRPVGDEGLAAVLEAGRLAPTAANRQPLHFIVVRDEARRKALGEAYGKSWFLEAPLVIVVCVEPGKAWTRSDGKNYADVDGAIAMDHMTLCAEDLGLGTCWIGAFDPAVLTQALGLPEGVEPLAMTPLGHPVGGATREKTRKPLEELVRYDSW